MEFPSPLPPPSPPTSWLRRRVLEPVRNLLRQGLAPAELALTVALGVAFGLVPVLGITTLLITFAAVRLRLNVAAMLLIGHLMSPVQLVLLIPLLRLGARLWQNGRTPDLTLEKIRYLIAHDWSSALQLLWHASAGALLLWAVGMVPLVLLLNFGLRPVFRRLLARQG
ncbi:DUF2062 domain-containing protein [Hymenobacter daecheongensis]|uniref:DUF2062 domain-containing protein n=1 Tax=Hymenobacter daecheongensis TaxID=496053 RepID=UPI00093558CE|nr:DUF2062 domain-containing protein [Hymenobacter daecheongensis]